MTERVVASGAALHEHPLWSAELPWLCQGITHGRDMSLFGRAPVGDVVSQWRALPGQLGCHAIVHSRQVHGALLLEHGDVPAGLYIARDADGHVTSAPGVLLAVSVADCVPVSIVADRIRAVGLLHAGWRSAAAGILERGIDTLSRGTGVETGSLRIHFGPAICGGCFEVGPEVPPQLGLADDARAARADGRCRVDLRAELARRAIVRGIPAARVTVSTFCTRCGDSPFFSHRAGCGERQIAVLGVRGDL